jgi:DNA-binding PadR family transcriptional regulator
MNVRARSQTFNPGELPLVLLALAESEPMKAYELLAELDRLFGPAYRSSPGGVYPALTALRVEGLLSAEPDGRAKRYHLTDAGREALQKRRGQLAALEERTGARIHEDGSLRPALDRFVHRVMKRSGRLDPELVSEVLERAALEIEQLKGGNVDRER